MDDITTSQLEIDPGSGGPSCPENYVSYILPLI